MTVDVVSREVGIGIGSPDQIHEWQLSHAGSDRLEARRSSRGKDVMRENFRLGTVVALDFGCGLTRRRNQGDDGDAVVVSFLPLEAVIDKLYSRGRIQRDLSDRDAVGAALLTTINTIAVAQVR